MKLLKISSKIRGIKVKKILSSDKVCIIAIIMFQIVLCILLGMAKKSFFCDEIYSYGLSNSENYSFIDPITARQYSESGWVDSKYFKDYIEVSSKDAFTFKAAFENQRNDVHPPLYYCLLHIVCAFNRDSFSKWTGLALNYFILIFLDVIMLYISKYIIKDTKASIMALLFWTFSAAGLSNILFIRMYLLLTFEILAYVAAHIRVLERQKFEIRDFIVIFSIMVCGGLTHYYFYLFVFCFSAPICFCLLLSKKIKKMLLYGGCIVSGALAAIIIFPSALRHIFSGYRGTEVINNLQSDRMGEVIKTYCTMINNSMFAGLFNVLIAGFIVLLGMVIFAKYFIQIVWTYEPANRELKLQVAKKDKKPGGLDFILKKECILEALIIFSYSVFALVAIKGSDLIHNRYLYPIYPVIAILLTKVIYWLLGALLKSDYIKGIVISFFLFFICAGSIVKYKIDFLYTDYDGFEQQAQEVRGMDCLLYCGDTWLDTYTAFPLKLLYDETYFLRPDEMDKIGDILSRRETADSIVVCLPDMFSWEDAQNVLNSIIGQCGYTSYREVYHFYTQAWLLQ